jgi:3-deoxy-D-manno-octulosonic-acid transferase
MLRKGRQNSLQLLKTSENNSLNKITVWVHCASLGEFEQGRPIIESIKIKNPSCHVVLSFFSPSGYEIRKNYDKADQIIYLPADTPENADLLISKINPTVVIFVKYEFWWNLIRALLQNKTPIFLISAVFRQDDYFFKKLADGFLQLLRQYHMIFVQDKKSAEVLITNKVANHLVAGDTRIDSVMLRHRKNEVPESIRQFAGNLPVVVYGSVWESDMTVVTKIMEHFPHFKHIVAPHDISTANVKAIRANLSWPSALYSDEKFDGNMLIINNIGMLAGLYSLAKYAYIGGGFDKGIHNILEPAVFGIPVFFGPNHTRFNEAIALTNDKSAFAIHQASEMVQILNLLESSPQKYGQLSAKVQAYFNQSKGATGKTMEYIQPFLSV